MFLLGLATRASGGGLRQQGAFGAWRRVAIGGTRVRTTSQQVFTHRLTGP